MQTFKIFVDGSATDQRKTWRAADKHLRRAGIGIFHPDTNTRIAEPFLLPNPTNNRAEYAACIRALQWVLDLTRAMPPQEQAKIFVVLYCDSQLLISSMTKWLPGWKRKGWKKADGKPVLNRDMIIMLDQLISNSLPRTTFVKVAAHKNKPKPSDGQEALWLWTGNHEADRLANEGRKIAEKISN